ncbi:MAG: type II toxin-antitoxin system HicB family antitoxin [Lachnospiraceae bacterium]|nr:type II toxin-antitoxin system HicB family antitoxin [Lachnospiraceae bacterium]
MKKEKKKDTYCYPALLTYEKGKEIAVEFPDLDVATSGVDDEDALISARELLGLTLFGMEEDGETIPKPSSLRTMNPEPDQKVILVDVFMPAIRLAQINRSVSRTVTLPAWLNAKAQGMNINFSQVLQDALKEKLSLHSI